jgi:hypothetical protein
VENPQKAKKLCENATKAFSKFDSFFFFFTRNKGICDKILQKFPIKFFFKKNPRTIASEWGFVGCELMCFFWFEAWKISLLKDIEKIVTWNS